MLIVIILVRENNIRNKKDTWRWKHKIKQKHEINKHLPGSSICNFKMYNMAHFLKRISQDKRYKRGCHHIPPQSNPRSLPPQGRHVGQDSPSNVASHSIVDYYIYLVEIFKFLRDLTREGRYSNMLLQPCLLLCWPKCHMERYLLSHIWILS